MSQTDKKRRKLAMAIGESFAAIRRRTVRSQALISLSAPALKVYIELRLRWRHKDQNNNGELFVSIAECKTLLGLAPATAHRAFRELGQKGFIVMTRQGEACGLTRAVLANAWGASWGRLWPAFGTGGEPTRWPGEVAYGRTAVACREVAIRQAMVPIVELDHGVVLGPYRELEYAVLPSKLISRSCMSLETISPPT